MRNRQKDQCLGAIIGVGVGDPLGAPYETWPPAAIAADINARGGLHLFDYPNPWATDGNGPLLPAGRPTDDSEQTACVAKWLLSGTSDNTDLLYKLLRASVIEQKSLLWDGKSTGAGGTTRNALSGDEKREGLARTNPIGTNGSLMRTSPMALWYYHELTTGNASDRALACEHIRTMSRVTHHHPHAVEACVIYAATLADLLRDSANPVAYRSYERVVGRAAAKDCPLYQRVCSFVEDPDYIPYDPGAFPARGTAEFSLVVALKALQETKSFAKGIEYAIRVGGDTDTYGAIAGGLLGARYGYRSIPTAWKEGILGKQVMKDLARKIYSRRINPPHRGL